MKKVILLICGLSFIVPLFVYLEMVHRATYVSNSDWRIFQLHSTIFKDDLLDDWNTRPEILKPNYSHVLQELDRMIYSLEGKTNRFQDLKSIYDVYTVDAKKLPKETHQSYFAKKSASDMGCFLEGTAEKTTDPFCHCKPNYHGLQCSIPDCVFQQHVDVKGFKIRETPRTIVHGIIVNHELELTELRFQMLKDVVDIFIVQESTMTTGGDPKPLVFLEAFKRGFLREFHDRIIHVVIDSFPEGFLVDGWKADRYLRSHLTESGLKRIQNLQPEDVIVSFDADEMPNRESLLFLKLHDGWTNPVIYNLRWSLYGYFWQHTNHITTIPAGCTYEFLNSVCQNDISRIRSGQWRGTALFKEYKDKLPPHKIVQDFHIGVHHKYGGHHCSWCFNVDGIILKLQSAQRADKPRWGDYPEKLNKTYIAGLISKGHWFDGTSPLDAVPESSDPDFAPALIMNNREKYSHYLKRLN